MFEIITTVGRNTEWLEPFFLSLSKTLAEPRDIRVISGVPITDICAQKLTELGTTWSFAYRPASGGTGKKVIDALDYGVRKASHPYVVILDVDAMMLKKGWDKDIERLFNKYALIGNAPRYKCYVENSFMAGSTILMIGAGFSPTGASKEELESVGLTWDGREVGSHINYIARKNGGELKCWGKRAFKMAEGGRWGDLTLDDDGDELIYHNFYSARAHEQKATGKEIPASEMKYSGNRLEKCADNAQFFVEYFKTQWPKPLAQVIAEFENAVQQEHAKV